MRKLLVLVLLVGLGFVAWVGWTQRAAPMPQARTDLPLAQQIARGAYLARAGNCAACHTARGGQSYAGGRGIETPFGTVYAGNLTPHANGLAGWSADDFWRALHEGRSRGGRALYPAFPYTAFTQVSRDDSDALFAFLQSLPPQPREATPHALRWPYDQAWALAVWRALHFRPEAFEPDAQQDLAWNRGAYLVRGLGHCASCHAPRNALGGTLAGPELGGGLMPVQNWHAPALGGAQEAAELVDLLGSGQSARGTALGPMAEVVLHSTQHLRLDDLQAMARYLASQAPPEDSAPPQTVPVDANLRLGSKLYELHCQSCHGVQGDGHGLYPRLAGNRTVNLISPNNIVKVIRQGGFAPNTAANPRPFGMPPFGHVLSDAELAAVATHVRRSFGNGAPPVSELQVLQAR